MGDIVTSVYDFLNGVAYFTGSATTAGLLLYVVVLLLILVFMKKARGRFFFIALPVTLVASALGILKAEVMYLLLIINLIGIVIQYRRMK